MSRIYDVTVPLSARVPVFPGDPRFEMSFAHRMDEGKPYNVARMTLGVHSGTHIDAPYHFLKDGATVEHLPLDVLIGPALVALVDAPRAIRRADVEALRLNGRARVLFKTRNGDAIRRPEFREDFVYLDPGAAEALVEAGVRLVGIDYLSVEQFGSPDFATHHVLLGAGTVVVEGLDLVDVPPGEYEVTCLPLPIVGADGSPARVVLRER